MSSYSDTRPARPRGDRISLSTLIITALASAAAAYTCSKIWASGTLASAAFTPVLVAIMKEALARPTEAVTRAVPIRGVVRSSTPGSQPPAPPAPPELERVAQPGEVTYHSRGGGMRRWRLAIVTGLLGFVVCVLVVTLPELVAGQSAGGGGRQTTLFGGHEQRRDQQTTTTAPAKTVTAPASKTVTVPAPSVKTTTTPPSTTTPVVPMTTTTPAPTTTEPPPDQP